ncbi:MAG: hypothetical protein M1837_001449 [Sclerophora amabilis]|nr:MAG: hypothetical protein M1837_001449 [Sclerophora amabilis]
MAAAVSETKPASLSSSSAKSSFSADGNASEVKTSLSTDISTAPPSYFDPTAEFHGDLAVTDKVPSQAQLDSAADQVVLAADGSSRPFKNLFSGDGVAKRVLVIFVRHFLCGYCQQHLFSLSQSITPDSLLSLSTPTFIAVVGCGSPDMIPMYAEATSCPFPIYADPSRKLYDLLGMTRTLNLGPKPEYAKASFLSTMVSSIVQGLKQGTLAIQAGDVKQVGGEFMIEDGTVTWCHRMRNTRDHSEMSTLRRVLNLDDVRISPAKKSWNRGVSKVLSRHGSRRSHQTKTAVEIPEPGQRLHDK